MGLQRVGHNWATNTQGRWHSDCEGGTDRTRWHMGVGARGTSLGRCQGFLEWLPGQGSWCSYNQKREINSLIEQPLLATHPQPFAVPLLPRLYQLLTFRDQKSQIDSISQLPLQLRVDVRPSFGWDLRKCLLKVPLHKKERSRSTASFPWTLLHEDATSRSGQPFCKHEAKSWSTKTREERAWRNWDMGTNFRAARLWSFLFI